MGDKMISKEQGEIEFLDNEIGGFYFLLHLGKQTNFSLCFMILCESLREGKFLWFSWQGNNEHKISLKIYTGIVCN